jgi:hypothetical protein
VICHAALYMLSKLREGTHAIMTSEFQTECPESYGCWERGKWQLTPYPNSTHPQPPYHYSEVRETHHQQCGKVAKTCCQLAYILNLTNQPDKLFTTLCYRFVPGTCCFCKCREYSTVPLFGIRWGDPLRLTTHGFVRTQEMRFIPTLNNGIRMTGPRAEPVNAMIPICSDPDVSNVVLSQHGDFVT